MSIHPGPRAANSGGARHNQLSKARLRLVTLLSHIRFGRLENLSVRNGEPVFDPDLRVVRTVKIAGTQQQPRRQSEAHTVGREVTDLLALLDTMGTGMIGRIEIAHGLPLFVELREAAPVV